ncbi:MAG: dual specificity protein kinase yak1 [Chrysothrix sp. TS-e1954]|nr:MAG: dual specificity protein kinase yak1 [Chrysothrix sp. TS-e1954]
MDPQTSGSPSEYHSRNPYSQSSNSHLQRSLNGFGLTLFGSVELPPVSSHTSSTSLASRKSSVRQIMNVDGDNEGDLQMEDRDPYDHRYEDVARDYPIRPHHRNRPSSQLFSQEASSAARRYSPMKLSPSSPTPPSNQYNPYSPNPQTNPQSPTRPTLYTSHSQSYYGSPTSRNQTSQSSTLDPMMSPENSYYPPGSATQQLNAVFGREQHSPRLPQPQQSPQPRSQPPQLTRCSNIADLTPRINAQPPFRRADPEGGFISPLQALTTHLPATYRICNPGFKYESSRNPRRVLTKPSKGSKNDGYDNEDSDYILYVNDILGSEETGHKYVCQHLNAYAATNPHARKRNRYLILDVLGQGTFGQVVKCQNLKTQEVVAVKVVKNRTAYFNQSMMEVSVLDLLNSKLDKNDDHHLLRLKDTFIHRQHLCLVFELLSVNLYELIKQNQFRGLSTTLVRVFAQQLLNGLSLLNKARIIHCDLKPENILLKNLESPIIKIIDFGSACDERQTVYTYIQSRFYRSPEVLLGLPYSAAIDMWSLGCIVVELFLGLPLFPGSSEYNQVSRITEMLGQPPTWMLEVGKQSNEFFEKTQDEFGRKAYRLKGMDQYAREHNTKEQPSKKYFSATTLTDIIKTYPLPRKNMKPVEVDREIANRNSFIDFVKGLLSLNPLERWSPQQAKLHPFITQQKFTGQFVPPMNLKAGSITKSPAPGVQQQQQAEAVSKQRQQAQQAQQAAQLQAQNQLAMQMSQYQHTPQVASPMYNSMYGQHNNAAPPPYPNQSPGYAQPVNMMQGAQSQLQTGQYGQHPNLHAQATARASRQRASTMDQQQSGIPPALQRVVSHLDPNAPIRLQPSPAYYPPPPDMGMDMTPGSSRRRADRTGGQSANRNRELIQNLENRSIEDGYVMGAQQWH